jgi:hypothetical protein
MPRPMPKQHRDQAAAPHAPSNDAHPEGQAASTGTWRELFKRSYMSFDRRTLGLTRFLLGFYLIMDLFRRTGDWEAMFSDRGVLPNWVILFRPQAQNFSFLHGFTTAPELWVLWAAILAVYVGLLVGWRTKLWQVLAVLAVTSMNGRVLLIENGGYVVQNLLVLWTAFLPLGDRFSLDSLLRSMRQRREHHVGELADRAAMDDPRVKLPFVSFVGIAIAFQFSAIYYFNVVHKTGPNWHNGTAVHYVLYVDRMITPLFANIREHVPFWLIKVMTPSVLVAEAIIPFCMLLPALRLGDLEVKLWLRRIAIFLICLLHIGFGSSFVLGPFAWALCVFSTVLFSTEDWEATIRAMRRMHRERTVIIDPESGALLLFSRVLARMDRFGLLGFDEARSAEEKRAGFSVLRPSGEVVTGSAALSDAIAALPIGTVFAWIPRLPGVASFTTSLMNVLRGRTSRFFGLDPERASRAGDPAPAPLPGAYVAKLRRRARGGLREAIVVVMFLAAFNQALTELWTTKKPWQNLVASLNQTGPVQNLGVSLSPHPEPMKVLSLRLRFLQGWFMFSPNPVMDDGTIVADCVTVDGRHIDPFYLGAPNYDLKNAKSFLYNQIWSDYFNRMHLSQNRSYRDAMVDYMRRLPERTGNPNDQVVSGEVYWIKDMNPKWGTRESYNQQKELLFSFDETGGAKEPRKELASR